MAGPEDPLGGLSNKDTMLTSPLKNCVSFKNHVCHWPTVQSPGLLLKYLDQCEGSHTPLGSMFGAFSNSAKFSFTRHA